MTRSGDLKLVRASLIALLCLLQSSFIMPTRDTTTKFLILTIWLLWRNFSLKRWQLIRNYEWTLLLNTSSKLYFGYLLESPHRGDSNKYSKHTFCEEIRIKHGICCISFFSLWILYNSKFVLMAISLGTNAVAVERVHCILGIDGHSYFYMAASDWFISWISTYCCNLKKNISM